MRFHVTVLLFLFLSMYGSYVYVNQKPKVENQQPLVLGIFPRFHPEIVMDSFSPMAKYLSKQLGRRVRLEASLDFSQFWEKVRAREFDIVNYNQYHYIRSHKEQNYEVIAMNEEQGRNTMTAAIVVRKDSDIKSIDDLRGKRILFGGSKQAMISYIFATYLLREGGLNEGDYEERFEINPPTAVVAAYHGLWDAAAAGTGDVALNQPVIKKQIDTGKLRYLSIGRQYGHIPWAVKGELPEPLKRDIQQALLRLNDSPKGKKILKKAKLSGISSASDSLFDPHRRITKLILNEHY